MLICFAGDLKNHGSQKIMPLIIKVISKHREICHSSTNLINYLFIIKKEYCSKFVHNPLEYAINGSDIDVDEHALGDEYGGQGGV